MEYKTSKFSLNQSQQNLRIGLVNLIRDHVERGMSKDELKSVLDSLEFVLSDIRFEKPVRSLDEEFYDAVFNIKKEIGDE